VQHEGQDSPGASDEDTELLVDVVLEQIGQDVDLWVIPVLDQELTQPG
jgi:hypothetical protein